MYLLFKTSLQQEVERQLEEEEQRRNEEREFNAMRRLDFDVVLFMERVVMQQEDINVTSAGRHSVSKHDDDHDGVGNRVDGVLGSLVGRTVADQLPDPVDMDDESISDVCSHASQSDVDDIFEMQERDATSLPSDYKDSLHMRWLTSVS